MYNCLVFTLPEPLPLPIQEVGGTDYGVVPRTEVNILLPPICILRKRFHDDIDGVLRRELVATRVIGTRYKSL